MYKETLRPAWVEVNLKNFEYNVQSVKKHIGEGHELIGVVKADGYGCGSVRICEKLRAMGVHWFATASLGEAVTLKTHGFSYDEGDKEGDICNTFDEEKNDIKRD